MLTVLTNTVIADQRIHVSAGNLPVQIGDQVFRHVGNIAVTRNPQFDQDQNLAQYRQVGVVESISGDTVCLRLERSGIAVGEIDSIEFHVSENSFAETLRLMMPPQTQSEIRTLILSWTRQHGHDVAASMVPIVQRSLRQSLPLIQAAVEQSLRDHSDEVSATVTRWKNGVVDESLVPLARDELLPIIRRNAAGPAESIGRDLWDRASLWGFAWRAVYDRTGLPKQDLVAEEWERFVDEEAVPVLEAHAPEIAAATQQILIDAAADQNIRDELATVAAKVAKDPLTQSLVRTILKEALLENETLRTVWSDAITAADTQMAFAEAGRRIEPMVRQIGDSIFGTRQSGITPGFARVLRNQILGRDRRWLMLRFDSTRSTPVSRIELATEVDSYPVVRLIEPGLDR